MKKLKATWKKNFLHNIKQSSLAKARRTYAFEALKLLRPSLLKNFKPIPTYNPSAMYSNYFKVAYRNLVKKKAHAFINILDLH